MLPGFTICDTQANENYVIIPGCFPDRRHLLYRVGLKISLYVIMKISSKNLLQLIYFSLKNKKSNKKLKYLYLKFNINNKSLIKYRCRYLNEVEIQFNVKKVSLPSKFVTF